MALTRYCAISVQWHSSEISGTGRPRRDRSLWIGTSWKKHRTLIEAETSRFFSPMNRSSRQAPMESHPPQSIQTPVMQRSNLSLRRYRGETRYAFMKDRPTWKLPDACPVPWHRRMVYRMPRPINRLSHQLQGKLHPAPAPAPAVIANSSGMWIGMMY